MLGKVEIAGVNTSTLKVLKNEESMELLRRARAGDQSDAMSRVAYAFRRISAVWPA